MTSFYDSYDYYKEMLKLQEKLRKSKEERIRLEERFKILAQESRNRHDACINRLRLRYIEFLEERRVRDERNHKVFEALDKVNNSLALMTAKRDRLNILRKQYEAYLRETYEVSNESESRIRDSNVAKQSEDAYLVKDVGTRQIALSSERKSSSPQRMFPLNDPVNRTLSPATPKVIQLPHDNYYFGHCQGIVVQPISLNHQTNERQNVFQNCSVTPDDANKQSSTRSPSSQSFQQKQLYNQPDKDLRVSYLSFSRPSSLGQQNVPHSNEPSLKRTEIARTVSQIVMPEYTGVPRYKFSDMSSNRFVPNALQHYVESSPTVQSIQEGNDRIVTGNMQRRGKITMRISPVSTTSRTPEWNTRGTSFLNKSFNSPRKTVPSYFSPPPRKSDYYSLKSVGQPPAHPLTTSDVDDMIKRHISFTQKSSGSPRLSTNMERATAEEEERRTALIVENELDRYIDKIRKLHRDLDAQSLEEIDQEQNITTASQLNDNSHPSIEDSPKENLPKDVEKVLALASDLASRAVELNIANESGKGLIDGNRNVGPVDDTWNDTPVLERNSSAFSAMNEGRQTSAPFAKDEIGEDIKLHEPKLDSLENIGKPREQSLGSLCNVLEQHERQLPKMQADKRANFDASSNNIENVTPENLQTKDDDTCFAQESNLGQCSFDVAEELEPWDMDVLQKRIKEIDLTDEIEAQASAEEIIVDASKLYRDDAEVVEFSSEANSLKNTEVGQDSKDDANKNETDSGSLESHSKDGTAEYFAPEEGSTDKVEAEVNDISVLRRSTLECEENDGNIVQNAESEEHPIDERMEFGDEQREERGENDCTLDVNNRVKIGAHGEEYNGQNYYEDTDLAENYTGNYETEYTGTNEEYNYEQNASYEGNPDRNYDPIVTYETEQEHYEQHVEYEANQDQSYEGNVAYETNRNEDYDESVAYQQANQNEGYGEYIGEQYVQESDEQYAEYVGEQYGSENRYEHDPNAQYQKDSNQQYAYTCDQQYDLNEVAGTSVNQSIEYTDCESNQPEHKEEKDGQSNEHEEPEKESMHREEKEEEPKINANQNNEEKISSENGPKKKKDVIKSLLDSDTDSTIERNVSNTESDFDFN